MGNKAFILCILLCMIAAACNVPSANHAGHSVAPVTTPVWIWDLNSPLWNMPAAETTVNNLTLHTPTPQLFKRIDFDKAFGNAVPASLSSESSAFSHSPDSAEWLFFEPAEYSTQPLDTLYAYFRNSGSTDWNEQYYLEFFAGTNPSTSGKVPLRSITKPGDRGVFQIPINSGASSWKACWLLKNPDGEILYEFCYNHGSGINSEEASDNKSAGTTSGSSINPAFVKTKGSAPARFSSDEQSAVFVSTSPKEGHTFKAYDHNEDLTVSFRNTGSETWDPSYRLVFYSGYNWMHAESFSLPGTTAPGETASFTLPMEIFEDNDKWVTCWYLSTPDGKNLSDFCFNYYTRS